MRWSTRRRQRSPSIVRATTWLWRSDASVPAAFPRSSPIVLRSACSALALAVLLAACGDAASAPARGSPSATGRISVTFTEIASVQNSGYDDDAAAVVV